MGKMKLKKGWGTKQITEDIVQVCTPYVRPDGDHITFYMNDMWLTDERHFWFEVQSRFAHGVLVEKKIKPVLEKYGVEFDPAGKEIYYSMENVTGNITKKMKAIYSFGEALNELYRIKFESEGEDG